MPAQDLCPLRDAPYSGSWGLWEDQSWDHDRVGWLSGQPVVKTGGVEVFARNEGGGAHQRPGGCLEAAEEAQSPV